MGSMSEDAASLRAADFVDAQGAVTGEGRIPTTAPR